MSSRKSLPSRASLQRMRAHLLDWYDIHQRDLPWRHTHDPYAIWLSETMLQQTRVETVIPYWERFLEHFPTVSALAEAEAEEVYGLWTGLGYYSRARNLLKAAGQIVADHEGKLPPDAESLRGLAGIGRYTAGAVSSIAFGQEEPLVDGNVIRVLARRFEIRADVTERSVIEHFWALAAELVRGPRPGDLNQALMELGATVCTPRSPQCSECPLKRSCQGRRAGDPEALPQKKKKARAQKVDAVAAWITRKNQALVVQRPEGGLLGGLWELPGDALGPKESHEAALVRGLAERVGLTVSHAEHVGEVEHLFTHRRLRLQVYRCPEVQGRVRLEGFMAHRWLSGQKIAALPQGGPTRKALSLLGVTSHSSPRQRMRETSEASSLK